VLIALPSVFDVTGEGVDERVNCRVGELGARVGGAVAQIARALGATVIGLDRHPPVPDAPAAAVIDHFITFDPTADVGAEIKKLTGGTGVDVVYDAVGGVTTPAALASLAHRGRLVVISTVGPRAVEIDLREQPIDGILFAGAEVAPQCLPVRLSAEGGRDLIPGPVRGAGLAYRQFDGFLGDAPGIGGCLN
jgi:Zinc-binding dehydrogenase